MRIDNIDIEKGTEEKVIHVEVEYPRHNEIDTVQIGLSDVRASDDIRVKYDFERDGWVILQPRGYHPKVDEDSYDYEEEWIESAFCQAWRYELEEEERFNYKPNK